ncbi:hypothetical protein LJC07_05190 [Christensenellaceae bacterium OttesenSCG-928-L17]|nr:hypothetical protein [Christensenellaceae bacterium OttesenSCG-928-L17]
MKYITINCANCETISALHEEVAQKIGFSMKRGSFVDSLWQYLALLGQPELSVEFLRMHLLCSEVRKEAERIYITLLRANLKLGDVQVSIA